MRTVRRLYVAVVSSMDTSYLAALGMNDIDERVFVLSVDKKDIKVGLVTEEIDRLMDKNE